MVMQECVSTRAKAAIGYEAVSLDVKAGGPADFVLFGQAYHEERQQSRGRKTIQELVYDGNLERSAVRSGVLLSRRRC